MVALISRCFFPVQCGMTPFKEAETAGGELKLEDRDDEKEEDEVDLGELLPMGDILVSDCIVELSDNLIWPWSSNFKDSAVGIIFITLLWSLDLLRDWLDSMGSLGLTTSTCGWIICELAVLGISSLLWIMANVFEEFPCLVLLGSLLFNAWMSNELDLFLVWLNRGDLLIVFTSCSLHRSNSVPSMFPSRSGVLQMCCTSGTQNLICLAKLLVLTLLSLFFWYLLHAIGNWWERFHKTSSAKSFWTPICSWVRME